jgi:myotubularin-related protein 9
LLTVQKNEGPVFVLFLDCVLQIYEQFRLSFEFNEDYLFKLFDNLYASEYGTFLGNCERERAHMQLSFRTYSLWSFINQPENMKSFINILYEPNNEPIWPNISPFSLDLWSNLYLRYQLDQTALEEAKSEIIKLKEKEIELKSKAIKLRK